MKKLTKSQVIALTKKENTLVVYLLPSNCSPLNQTWVKPMRFTLFLNKNDNGIRVNEEQERTFDQLINEFSYYNCNSELGNRVHYYIEEKEDISAIQSEMCKHASETIRKEAPWIL